MEYLTVKEAAEKWGISGRVVTYHIVDGRIPGVVRKGNIWLIPASEPRPEDLRKQSKHSRLPKKEAKP